MFPFLGRKTVLIVAARLVVGYLVLQFYSPFSDVEAAPAQELVQELSDQSDSRVDESKVCTPIGMVDFLNQTKDLTDDDIELIYETCRDKFLQDNQISSEVKETVDQWVGTDLSKVELDQVVLIYQLALSEPAPEKVSEQFSHDCTTMIRQFETYRETIEPLTNYIDIDLDAMIGDSDGQIDDQERDLLNFVQYAQFCSSILISPENENV